MFHDKFNFLHDKKMRHNSVRMTGNKKFRTPSTNKIVIYTLEFAFFGEVVSDRKGYSIPPLPTLARSIS